ncbi:MAG: PilZ domain-containing protein [Phycisphaerales bacterium]|nr:PilZ domain-containing protein [Phycisphaerales bacterium]
MSTLRLIERRQFPRFVLEPMYTPLAVRTLEGDQPVGAFDIEGHAYDISEGGARFELDRPLKPGTRVAMQITLPSISDSDIGPGRSILVFANVVWLDEDDQIPPYRMAVVFTHFARAGDRDRLVRQFASGRYRAAA